MKAFVVTAYGPDGLRETEAPRPTLGAGDVRVEVRAASINPLDAMIRNGEFRQLIPYVRPFVLGHDLAGVVTAIGDRVTGFAVGDEVYARPRDGRIGAFAEEIAIDAADVALKPTSLSFEEAAAVPLVALAAWQALVEVAHLRAGQKLLALGADVVIDFTTQDFTEVVSGYDLVLDSLGPASLEKSLTVLKPGGLALSVAGPPDPAFARRLGKPLLGPVMALLSGRVRRRARKLGVRYSFFFMRADGARLAELAKLYDDGTLRPVLDRTFPFDETVPAMAYVEQGMAKGKIVVTMSR